MNQAKLQELFSKLSRISFEISEELASTSHPTEPTPAAPPTHRANSAADLEIRITDILHELGLTANLKGYHFSREAITMAAQDMSLLSYVTKTIYPTIAKHHRTTTTRVERAIRHAIEVMWLRGNTDAINRHFGHFTRKPTNSAFIAHIADVLQTEAKAAGRKEVI